MQNSLSPASYDVLSAVRKASSDALLRLQKARFHPRVPLFDNLLTIESPLSQPRDGGFLAISGREPELDRGQRLSDRVRHIVVVDYRRRG